MAARWKPADCDYVLANYGRIPVGEIAAHLGRTAISIYDMSLKLNCGPVGQWRHLSHEKYFKILSEEFGGGELTWHQRQSKKPKYSHRRWWAWLRLRTIGYSLPSIGRCAEKHHTTVLHGTQRAMRMLPVVCGDGEGA